VEKAKLAPVPVGTLRTLPSVLISLCLSTAAVDALLVKEPSLLLPLREGFQIWLGPAWVAPSSASLIASSIAVACIAISGVAIFGIIQGVQVMPHGRSWAMLAFAVAAAAAGYAAGYVPVNQRLLAQEASIRNSAAQHSTALAALRARFATERAALEQQLEQEREHAQHPGEAGAAGTASPPTSAPEP
jgi:hypothetical protein